MLFSKNKEFVENLYHNIYKNFLDSCPFEKVDFDFRDNWVEKPSSPKTHWGNHADPFLTPLTEDTKTMLALDIVDKGTYFPVFIKNPDFLIEGLHRVESLKEAYSRGMIEYKKLIAINLDALLEFKQTTINFPIPPVLHERIQEFLLSKNLFFELFESGRYDYVEVEISTPEEWYKIHQFLSTTIRNLMYGLELTPIKELNP